MKVIKIIYIQNILIYHPLLKLMHWSIKDKYYIFYERYFDTNGKQIFRNILIFPFQNYFWRIFSGKYFWIQFHDQFLNKFSLHYFRNYDPWQDNFQIYNWIDYLEYTIKFSKFYLSKWWINQKIEFDNSYHMILNVRWNLYFE